MKSLIAASLSCLATAIALVVLDNNGSESTAAKRTKELSSPRSECGRISDTGHTGPEVTKSHAARLRESSTLQHAVAARNPQTNRSLGPFMPASNTLKPVHRSMTTRIECLKSRSAAQSSADNMAAHLPSDAMTTDMVLGGKQPGSANLQQDAPTSARTMPSELQLKPSVASALRDHLQGDELKSLGDHEQLAVSELGRYATDATHQLESDPATSDIEKTTEKIRVAEETNTYLRVSLGFAGYNRLSFLAAAKAAVADPDPTADRKSRKF